MSRRIQQWLGLPLGLTIAAVLASTQANAQERTTTSPAVAANDGSAPPVSPLDSLELFVGLDGSKQPQDLGINANMGVRLAANLGVPISSSAGIGLQIGAGINFSDAAVHVLEQIDGTSRRTQTYVTVGLFQRGASRLSWAAGYDLLHQRYYDTFTLGQLRAEAAYRVTRTNDVGAWMTVPVQGDRGAVGTTPVRLDPIPQLNGFFRRTWPTGARTTLWAGVAGYHHNVVLVFPDNSRDETVFVYGAQLEMPLSNRLSITGAGNFVTPTSTGTVDAYLGITYYPGRRSPTERRRFAPAMFVGNNPEFAVDLQR